MRIAILLGLAFVFTAWTAQAQQLHIYKTPDGRTVIGNAPPPANAEGVSSYKPSDPANRSTPPVPIESYEPPPSEPPPAVVVLEQPPPEPKIQSKPVGTRELALIRRGMSQYEVKKRLGEPQDVIQLGEREVYSRYRAHGFKNTIVREQWVYPGSFKYDPASIVFENGRVVATGRER